MNKKLSLLAVVAATMLLSSCSSAATGADTNSPSSVAVQGAEPTQSTTPAPAASFDAAAVEEQLIITTYAGDQPFIYRPQGFVFVENPTDFDLSVSCYMKLIDDESVPIAERDQTFHLGANSATAFSIFSMAPDEVSESAGSIEYDITDVSLISEAETCALTNFELSTSLNDNKNLIIQAKNISEEESVEVNAWLFDIDPDDGEMTSYSLSGILPSRIQPGETYTTEPYGMVCLVNDYKLFFYCEREAARTEGIRMLK